MFADSEAYKKYYAIIVAGGSGARMHSTIPKQFLLLNGRAVLMHTIEAFNHSDFEPSIIVVIPEDYHEYWKTLCVKHNFQVRHLLVEGGPTRFQSVKNALASISDNLKCIVAIHDAVRPLTTREVINDAYRSASEKSNAVVAVRSRDSVRLVSGDHSKAISRENVFLIQTPQVFDFNQLSMAYKQEYTPEFTDDAAVVEKAGFMINLIEGDYTNIKITHPEDLEIANLILKKDRNRLPEQ